MRHFVIFKQYLWLVETIASAGEITFATLQSRWLQSSLCEGRPYARTTFVRHKSEIEELFALRISCRRKGDGYYYYIEQCQHSESVPQWMASTLRLSGILATYKDLHDRILLEPIPTEGQTLQLIATAMKRNLRLLVNYHKFCPDSDKQYVVEPYCLKLYRQRWYMLAHFHKYGSYLPLSLDRMTAVSLTDETFQLPENFNAAEFYRDEYGIASDNSAPVCRVVLRAYDTEPQYLDTLPLHHSQHLLQAYDDCSDYEFHLRPSWDFQGYLLSRCNRLEVLEPQWLADEIALQAKAIVQLYE